MSKTIPIKNISYPFSRYKWWTMLTIKKKYIIDENDQKVAVQLDIETFRRIEQVLENYALVEMIKENKPEDSISMEEAKAFYKNIQKSRLDG